MNPMNPMNPNRNLVVAAIGLAVLLCIAAAGIADDARPTTQPTRQPTTASKGSSATEAKDKSPTPADAPAKPTPDKPRKAAAERPAEQPPATARPTQPAVPVTPTTQPSITQKDQHIQPLQSTPANEDAPPKTATPRPTVPTTVNTPFDNDATRTFELLRNPVWWRGQFGLRIIRPDDSDVAYLVAPGGVIALPAAAPPPGPAYQHRQALINERPAAAAILIPRTFRANRQAFYPRMLPSGKPFRSQSRATGPRTIGTQPTLTPKVGSSFSPGTSLR